MDLIERFKPPESWQEGDFKNKDGANIHYGFATPKGASKGIVVITTGYAGFGRAYFENLNNYLDEGYTVYAMDWRGHGESDPFDPAVTPYEKRFESHVHDLHQLVTEIIKPDGGQPLIMSTHSLGGLIAMLYVHDHPDVFDGVIPGAPMLDVNTHGFPKAAWRLFVKSMVSLGYGENPLPSRNLLTRFFGAAKDALGITKSTGDLRRAFARALSQTHLGHKIVETFLPEETEKAGPGDVVQPSFNWMYHAFPFIDRVNQENFLQSIKTPVLFGICTEDDLVDNAAIFRAARLSGNGKNIVVLEGSDHSLWHERDEIIYEWWIHIVNFLDEVVTRFNARRDMKSENRTAFTDAAAIGPEKTPYPETAKPARILTPVLA